GIVERILVRAREWQRVFNFGAEIRARFCRDRFKIAVAALCERQITNGFATVRDRRYRNAEDAHIRRLYIRAQIFLRRNSWRRSSRPKESLLERHRAYRRDCPPNERGCRCSGRAVQVDCSRPQLLRPYRGDEADTAGYAVNLVQISKLAFAARRHNRNCVSRTSNRFRSGVGNRHWQVREKFASRASAGFCFRVHNWSRYQRSRSAKDREAIWPLQVIRHLYTDRAVCSYQCRCERCFARVTAKRGGAPKHAHEPDDLLHCANCFLCEPITHTLTGRRNFNWNACWCWS